MSYIHIIDPCFEPKIGTNGISQSEFESTLSKTSQILGKIVEGKDSGELPLFSISENSSHLKEIREISDKIRTKFSTLFLLGTGGSSLSGQCLAGISKKNSNDFKIIFMDNVDPETLNRKLSNANLKKTCFLAISKSGKTIETLAQLGSCLSAVSSELGEEAIKERFIVITDPAPNPLRRIGKNLGITVLDHEKDIGGRFSIFTNVGLIAASLSGIDIGALCKGAAKAVSNGVNCESSQNSEPAKGAVINYLMMNRGVHAMVFMPYIDMLAEFTMWLRRIWAESLGKDGKGTTPIKAMGTLDQHSQMQLYLDGPNDKMFTFFSLENLPRSIEINHLVDGEVSYLNGRALGDVLKVSFEATTKIMINKNLPVRSFIISDLNEETLGELIMHFILETVITAKLMGVNPFDQPAVEAGKNLARELLEEM